MHMEKRIFNVVVKEIVKGIETLKVYNCTTFKKAQQQMNSEIDAIKEYYQVLDAYSTSEIETALTRINKNHFELTSNTNYKIQIDLILGVLI